MKLKMQLKNIALTAVIIMGIFLVAVSNAKAVSVFITQQGGTGTSTPSGILSGDNGATSHLNTVIIGTGLSYSGNTLSTTGGGSGTVSTSSAETANYIPKWTTTGATPALLAGTSLIYDTGTKVGIGTTSPSNALEVETSGSSATFRIDGNSSTVASGITINDELTATNLFTSVVNPSGTANSNLATVPKSATFQTGAGTTGGIYFVSKGANSPIVFGAGGSTFAKEIMRLDGSTGFVGIGTTTPGSALSIQGNIFLAGNIVATSTATSTFAGAVQSTCFTTNGTSCISAGGSGTVTSVATNNGLTGGTITTTGTIGLATIVANSVLANSSGSSAVPTALATSSIFTGTIGQTGYFSGTGSLVGTSTITIDTTSNVGISSTTPGSLLAVGTSNGINFTTATTSFSSTGGINIASGCFSQGGTCLQTFIQNSTAYKSAANYASTTTLPAYLYANGTSGVGATIAEVGNGALYIDGNNPTVGQRVLIKNESGACTSSGGLCINGVYTVTATGSAIATFLLTRSTDFNSSNDVYAGVTVPVLSGTANGGDSFVVTTTGVITIGTTGITFAEASAAGGGVASIAQTYGTAQTGTITIATSTTAINSDWGITNSSGAFTFNIPTATASIRGLLSGTDWTTFNGKLSGNQTITLSGAVTGSGATAITTAYGVLAQGILGNPFSASTIPTALATSTIFGSTATFLTSGLVGIGSTTPGFTLSVQGTIYTTTGVRFPDGTLQTTAAGTPASRTIYSSTVQSTIGTVTSTTTMRTVPIPANTLNGTTQVLRITAQFAADQGSNCYFNTIYGDGSASTTIGFAASTQQAIIINNETASTTSNQMWSGDGTSMDGNGLNTFGPTTISKEYVGSHITAFDTTGKTYLAFAARTINSVVCSINAVTVELVSQ